MWIDAMLHKLYHHMGITGKTWRIIQKLVYQHERGYCVNGLYSREYNIYYKVLDKVVSYLPGLFLVYINDLISEFRKQQVGNFTVHYLFTASPNIPSDDITRFIVTVLKTALDHLLDILNTFSRSWRVIFNIKKRLHGNIGEKVRKNSNTRKKLGF